MSTERIQTHEIGQVDIVDSGVRVRGQRRRVSSVVRGHSLTKQADKDRANIHAILGRYQKTGLLPQVTAQPLAEIIPSVESFHEAMNIVTFAQQSFEALPVAVRQKFENNPAKLLEFVSDPKNNDELVKLGLANAPEKAPAEQGASPSAAGPSAPPEGGAAPAEG